MFNIKAMKAISVTTCIFFLATCLAIGDVCLYGYMPGAWCDFCSTTHSGGSESSSSSSDYDIGQEANNIGQGGAIMTGSVAGIVAES